MARSWQLLRERGVTTIYGGHGGVGPIQPPPAELAGASVKDVIATRPSRERVPAHPRVLIVMTEQWHRALLRAALREVGYDAVGTRTLTTALRIRPAEPGRGPIRLIIVDHAAVTRRESDHLTRLLQLHGRPATMLLARSTMNAPLRRWDRVLRRPLSISDIVAGALELLPLPMEARHPID